MQYTTDRELAEQVKARAMARNKTQRTLAQELGISEAYLSDFLNGRRNAGPTILKRLGYDPTPHYRKLSKAELPADEDAPRLL